MKPAQERNRLGQYATPPSLAQEIVQSALMLLPADAPIRYLEPGFGTGPFFSSLLNTVARSRIATAVGYEIDPHYGLESQSHFASTPLALQIRDFTAQTPPSSGKFNLLICNPPYVRHHHLSGDQKSRLQQRAEDWTGVRLSQLAGLYCYFLLISQAWLADDAVAAWLIPSEFMDVNYGQRVKEFLLDRITLLRVHRFDPVDVQFQDALVSSVVLWIRNRPREQSHSIDFTFGGTIANPVISRSVPAELLHREKKWTAFPGRDVHEPRAASKQTVLGDLFTIKRGIATGCNEFFMLTAEAAHRHRIPKDFLLPILPSPRYLKTDVVMADRQGGPMLDDPLHLLSCDLPEHFIEERHPTLWEYLQSGVKVGIDTRYLCRHRPRWYMQEKRPPAPFLCTYMGRKGTKTGRPFRFILNHSAATAANVYLLLYPKASLAERLVGRPEAMRDVWEALNSITPQSMVSEGRVYGGGLHKLEPNELANVPADAVLEAAQLTMTPGQRQLRLLDD
jgi:hypothetical protein